MGRCVLKINKTVIDENSPSYIIAELSANHNKEINLALETVHAAKESGANCIKLQTVNPDLITFDCDNDYFQLPKDSPWAGKTYYQLEQETYLPREWHYKIIEEAQKLGLDWFSSPFDLTAIDFLEELDAPAYKIASFEITDIALIKKAAETGKPVILSTGIATLSDIELAVNTCREAGNNQIAVLKCTSAYPTPYSEVNLKTIPNIAETFSVISGLSDHTLGHAVALGATALGGKIIEKHFILDRSIPSADADFSMQPEEFKQMVDNVRILEQSLGQVTYKPTQGMISGRKLSRSLFYVKGIKKGELITPEHVRSIRPGDGLHPKNIGNVIGARASRDIDRGTPVTLNSFN